MPYDAPGTGLDLPFVDMAELESRKGSAPWRCPLVATPSIRIVLLCMTPGTRTIPHFHPRAVEAFQVVRGLVGLTVGDDPEYEVGPGSVVYAARGVTHAIRIPGPDSAVLMCIVSPNEDEPDEQVDVANGSAPADSIAADTAQRMERRQR
jgi:quercetin dioxygenase-like cupin family protein